MNYNFSDRVRKVLAIAREEALRLHHDYVGTEHLLLGLIREGEGIGAAVLGRLDGELDQVRERVEEAVGRGESIDAPEKIPYRPSAKKALEYAIAEARNLDYGYVGTEHLLLGLLHVEDGVAAGVLNAVGVELEEARSVTVEIVDSEDALADGSDGEIGS